eukprot:580051-Rhodomonas_salina.1
MMQTEACTDSQERCERGEEGGAKRERVRRESRSEHCERVRERESESVEREREGDGCVQESERASERETEAEAESQCA